MQTQAGDEGGAELNVWQAWVLTALCLRPQRALHSARRCYGTAVSGARGKTHENEVAPAVRLLGHNQSNVTDGAAASAHLLCGEVQVGVSRGHGAHEGAERHALLDALAVRRTRAPAHLHQHLSITLQQPHKQQHDGV